ncbi:MAG TPA: hypothetical protein PK546_05705, partial [Chitinophagales bacterium]|nr:hypothetical protein [Chitinophagales bacterium]
TKERELLQSQLISFKIYIQRQKKIGYHKDFFNTIIEQFYFLQTIDIAKGKNKSRLKQEFLSQPNLQDKDWFLEMLN